MSDPVWRSRWVMAGHVRTHYIEAGHSGPPVVLLHGGNAGTSAEISYANILPALAEHFTVFAPDAVGGHGGTDPNAPASEGGQSRVDHTADFVDALCLDQFCIAGVSVGGWAATKYTVLHPERVKKLCFIDSTTLCESMGVYVRSISGPPFVGTRESMRAMLERQIYHKDRVTDELVDKRTALANQPGHEEARQRANKGARVLQEDPRLRVKFDLSHALPLLTVPAMGLWGKNDLSVPEGVLDKLAAKLPNIPIHIIDECAHQMTWDQPEILAKKLIEFFGS